EIATFLTRNEVAFERVAHDLAPTSPAGDGPVLELRDGRRLVSPTLRQIATGVGLSVQPEAAEYDVIIVGAGPAGLTAAVNGAAEGLRTVVIESLAPGGQAG